MMITENAPTDQEGIFQILCAELAIPTEKLRLVADKIAAYRVQIEQSSRVGEGDALWEAVGFSLCPICNGQFDPAEWDDATECPECEQPTPLAAAVTAMNKSMEVFASYMGDPDGKDDVHTAKIEAAKIIRDYALANPPLAPVVVREALEAVAADLRLNEQGGFITTDLHETTIAKVLAALQSSPSSHVPKGYALVPVEPTEEMLEAVEQTAIHANGAMWTKLDRTEAADAWREMLSAAPALQAGEDR